jgi:2-C-methyl-D-erythritol 4-phosphate cytidylyltransferase
MRASAIIVAAGSGTRLGFQEPKAFVQIAGATLLAYSLRTLKSVADVSETVIAIPSGMEQSARIEVREAGLEIPVKITPGGTERQDSVRIALSLISAEAELVIIHDAARPFATAAMFNKCLNEAARSGGAIAAIPLADTLKRVVGRKINATVPRAELWQAQTPQAFQRETLMRAHEFAMRERFTATDDADLVERMGVPVAVVEGSALNFKITTPDDLRMAEAIAQSLSPR